MRLDNYLGRFFVYVGDEYTIYLKFVELNNDPFDILSNNYFRAYSVTQADNVYCFGETKIDVDDFNDLLDLEEITQQQFYDAVKQLRKQTKQMILRWKNSSKNLEKNNA